MTTEEWVSRGYARLDNWAEHVTGAVHGYSAPLSDAEESAFMYAWKLAGREVGIVSD